MDKTKNFVVGKVVTAPNPATTGTSITVSNGSLFPDPSTFGAYNLCVWSQADDPSPTTCEIVRVTAKTTSGNNAVLTVTRSQEGTTGLSIAAGWKAYYSLTQKYFDDLETAVTNTDIQAITATATQTISITALGAKRFNVTQSENCTYTLTPSQAGLVWVMKISKTAGNTVAFSTGVTLDDTVDDTWTSCTIAFISWATNQIKGYILDGE